MPKRLIVCADGTWNTENEKDQGHPCPTNVSKIARAIVPTAADGTAQLVHYEKGVGTDLGEKVRGGAVGRGLFQNVADAYDFLVHNYEDGDALFFFGFSRGAYTVRSLAGLIRTAGILKRGEEGQREEAFALYRDYDPKTAPDGPVSVQFRADHSWDSDIACIGVWDTVGALGVPWLDGRFRLLKGLDWQFHDVSLSRKVQRAFHALAIHEHRAEFVPTLWEQKPDAPAGQVLEQVWFSGVHSDVGGGYPGAGLSDVALGWMLERVLAGKDLEIDRAAFPGFAPDPLADGHDSFGTFYKVLDWIEHQQQGALREYHPGGPTHESIHPSVRERFAKKSGERWPASFQAALSAG